MCLGLPGRLIRVEPGNPVARVDVAGVERDIDVSLLAGPLVVGDYLLVHSGFALERISAERAAEVIPTFAGPADPDARP